MVDCMSLYQCIERILYMFYDLFRSYIVLVLSSKLYTEKFARSIVNLYDIYDQNIKHILTILNIIAGTHFCN